MGEKVLYQVVSKNEKQNGESASAPNPPEGFGARHMQTLILFICVTVAFSLRANLSVTMVVMTSHEDHCLLNNSGTINGTEFNNAKNSSNDIGGCGSNPSKWSVYRKYDWDQSKQEMIVFAFFVGYVTMQLPMGMFAQKYGGKLPIVVALLVNGVVSLVTPWMPILGGWVAMCASRLLQGMTQAALYPSIHTLLSKWTPLSERGRLSTYIYTGSQFGTIVIFQVSGLFAGSPSFGWPATFWFCGVLSLATAGLLMRLGASSPHEHSSISSEEMAFIMAGVSADVVPKKRKVPWKHILSSPAVWALVVAHAGSASGYILVLTQIPTYMNHVLGVEVKKNGFLSSLPYLAMYLTALLFGWLTDHIANKKILSIVNIRRIANTIGIAISAFFLIGFSFVTSTTLAVTMLVFTMATHSAAHVGFHINHIDLAPNFAGNIMALGNMIANITSLTVPVIVSNIVKDDTKNQHKWQIVFFIFAGLQCLTNTIFVIFCKGTVQPWNFYGDEDNVEKEDLKNLEKKNSIANETLHS